MLYGGYRIYDEQSTPLRCTSETLENTVRTVAVTNAQPMAPTETITLPGNIVAWFEAPIYAQVSGYVKMWYKDYGALVKKGDILAEINAPALDAQYAQAKADLESERALYGLAEITAKRWVAMRTTPCGLRTVDHGKGGKRRKPKRRRSTQRSRTSRTSRR